eukprot:95460_1
MALLATVKRYSSNSDDKDAGGIPRHLPQLKRRHGNHVRRFIRASPSNDRPCYTVVKQFAKYPHIIYCRVLITGYLRQNAEWLDPSDACMLRVYNDNIPSHIVHLCNRYVFAQRDGIFQLSHKIHRVLKKARLTAVPKETLKTIIYKYLNKRKRSNRDLNPSQVALFLDELIRLKYIELLDHSRNMRTNKLLNVLQSELKIEPMNETSRALYRINEFMQMFPKP